MVSIMPINSVRYEGDTVVKRYTRYGDFWTFLLSRLETRDTMEEEKDFKLKQANLCIVQPFRFFKQFVERLNRRGQKCD